MSTPSAPLWTPAQQSWLQAMGYTVFVDGSVEAAPEASRAEPRFTASRAGPGPTGDDLSVVEPGAARLDEADAGQGPGATRRDRPAPPPRREAPAAEDPAANTPQRTGSRRPAVRMPPPLQIALLRASGCNPNDPDTQALMASWNLDQLRGNAAAKRALWPQLRALRKRSRA